MNAEQRQQVVANLSAIHHTMDVLIDVGDLESAGNIAATLSGIWHDYRYIDEGIRYTSSILDAPGVDELSDALLATLYDTYGGLIYRLGHYEKAEVYYKTALAKHIDAPRTTVDLLVMIGMTAYQRGQYEAAREYCGRALALATQLDLTEGLVGVYHLLAELAWAQGNQVEALDGLAYAHALAEQQGFLLGLARTCNMQGEMERARHNYRPAIDHYQASAALFKAESPAQAMVVQGNLAFALLAVGDVPKAATLFARGYRYWEGGNAPYISALCLTGLAGVHLATHSYRQAARLLSLANQRFAHSDGRLDLADRLEYERIEASLQAHLSRDELRSIQERVAREDHNACAGGPVSLTETAAPFGEASAVSSRELEILRLVARGLTDKQIAVQCCISPHTVNSHMRAVYRKLQVNNRSAAVHVVHRRGLL
jgi:DNA-binding CsgD family transcriptional regulator